MASLPRMLGSNWKMQMDTDIWLMLMFISYKIVCLAVGLLFSYMGYKLFLADKNYIAGEMDAKSKRYRIVLKKAAPGTFFSRKHKLNSEQFHR